MPLFLSKAQLLRELINSLRPPLRLTQRRICRGDAAPVAIKISKYDAECRAKHKHDHHPQRSLLLSGTLVHRGLSDRLTRSSSFVAGVAVSATGSPVMSMATGFTAVDTGF